MSGERTWNLLVLNFIAASVAITGVVACSIDGKVKPISLPSKASVVETSQTDDVKPVATVEPVAQEPKVAAPESLSMNLVDLSAGGRQRKSSLQLQKSFVSCVGSQSEIDAGAPDEANPSILQISSDMIISSDSTSKAKGRFGFLVVSKPEDVLGKSILELEKSFIDVEGTTSGVKASSLEDELYLNSLQNIASVIAFNCDVESESSQCFCSTREKAKAMVERCLTLFDSTSAEFTAAFDGFAEACSADTSDDGLLKRRKAIVSLLSSYAFATSK